MDLIDLKDIRILVDYDLGDDDVDPSPVGIGLASTFQPTVTTTPTTTCKALNILTIQKPLTDLFPELFRNVPLDPSNYLMGTTSDGKQIGLPLTHVELKKAKGMEVDYENDGGGKFVLVERD